MTHQNLNQFTTISPDQRSHAVVIGSGFGGLAAAVRLGARGYRVTVVERLDQPGGRARVFEQDGFRFDAGPTIITMPQLFEDLWALCGKRLSDHVTLKSLDPFYTLRFEDGSVFRGSADPDTLRAEIERFSPGDLAGHERLLAISERCFDVAFTRMADTPFPTLMSMTRALPDLLALRAYRSVYDLVAKHIKDERLRVALSFHPLFLGGNPQRSSAALFLVAHLEREFGVHYAMGGTGALVRGLVDLIEDQGNEILLDSGVREIRVENGRAVGVDLENGICIDADVVVSNADVGTTYRSLVPGQHRRRWTDAKLARTQFSMSLLVWYFGTDRQYPEVDHHTILMVPRYLGLLDDIFDNKVLADDFSLYLHRPTATDPSMAPDGCDAFYVLSPVPNLDGATDWEAMAEPYRQKIEAHLESTIMPGLSDSIVTSRMMTPLDFRDDLQSYKGSAFGIEPRLTQLAWFRPHNKSEDIENLFIVGAGTHPGAGVPGVLSAARILDKVVPDAVEIAR